MVDLSQLGRKHTRACARVQAFLLERGFVALDDVELASFGLGYSCGWKIPHTFEGDKQLTLVVLVNSGFPLTPPRLAIFDSPPLLTWPHLEERGVLCVFQDALSFDITQPEAIVAELLDQGTGLLQSNLNGQVNAEFQREFVSYWNRDIAENGTAIWSLVAPDNQHRLISVWTDGRVRLVADDEKELRRWLSHGEVPIGQHGFYRGGLIWLDPVPVPATYPKTGADLFHLVQHDLAALKVLGDLFAGGGQETDIVLGVQTTAGVGFGAVHVYPPRLAGAPGRRVDPILKGFRPKHVPATIAARRALSPAVEAAKVEVQRIDHNWVHGRDADARQAVLQTKKVVLVGVGSLGSTVASIVARAGVGTLTLIDHDKLKWENLGRHALGAGYVGKYKSTSLATELTAALPHLKSVKAINSKLLLGGPAWEVCGEADLIISTTGNWQIEELLNELQQEGKLPPVQFAWLEAHAAAAHSVIVNGQGSCLQCGMGPAGQPYRPVTQWPANGLVQVPACGGMFSPYGASELTYAHALVAEHALDHLLGQVEKPSQYRVWIGRTAQWGPLGGAISHAWLETYGDPGPGGRTMVQEWPHDPDCPVCKRRLGA